MARYTGADCKRCRREKVKLFLKGSKCDGPKCPIESRPYPPGQHGRGRSKESEYLLQMREKQKCARIYGVLEKQFRGYYEEANRKQGKTGENLLVILAGYGIAVRRNIGEPQRQTLFLSYILHRHKILCQLGDNPVNFALKKRCKIPPAGGIGGVPQL